MKINHEIEFKTLITEDVFQKMVQDYSNAEIHDQTNTYYESTSCNMKEMGFAMRIRDLEGNHLFTMKQKAEQGHQEYEMYLDDNSPEALFHPELKLLFDRFHITGPFVIMGSLHTIRRSIQLNYGELCLDENEYCGIKDYEIEFEIDNDHQQEAQEEFEQLLNAYNITYRQAKPKRTRCILKMKEGQI